MNKGHKLMLAMSEQIKRRRLDNDNIASSARGRYARENRTANGGSVASKLDRITNPLRAKLQPNHTKGD